jgi:hypothetical protein
MITLLTKSPGIFNKEFIKGVMTDLVEKKRGPHAVLESLKRGLRELHVPFQVNPKRKQISETVHVLSGINALRYAIDLKKRGVIRKLIVGPNLVVLPAEANKIICSEEIDIIIFPSNWPRALWLSLDSHFENKIKIWAAGTALPAEESSKKKSQCILYQKIDASPFTDSIYNEISKHYEIVKIFQYGTFNQEDYFDELNSSQAMVYLSNSESQGLALQEAWMRNVPTIVWNGGYFNYKGITWRDRKISAPYLDEDRCGILFESEVDFKDKLSIFLNRHHQYKPLSYCLENFTDKICAEKYLLIIK